MLYLLDFTRVGISWLFELDLNLDLDLDLIWIWKWHWNMNAFMDIRRRHDCLASRISHFAFRISHPASRISLPVSRFPSRLVCLIPAVVYLSLVVISSSRFLFFFFQSSASAFVFGIPYIRIFFSSAWSNSKKGGVQGHNAS
jgi:hypothetical protein